MRCYSPQPDKKWESTGSPDTLEYDSYSPSPLDFTRDGCKLKAETMDGLGNNQIHPAFFVFYSEGKLKL